MHSEETNQDQVKHLPAAAHHSTTSRYEIRVKDHLDSNWWRWFEGWSLANLPNGEMLISISDVDQAALHGVLNKIRDLNLTLLSVIRKE